MVHTKGVGSKTKIPKQKKAKKGAVQKAKDVSGTKVKSGSSKSKVRLKSVKKTDTVSRNLQSEKLEKSKDDDEQNGVEVVGAPNVGTNGKRASDSPLFRQVQLRNEEPGTSLREALTARRRRLGEDVRPHKPVAPNLEGLEPEQVRRKNYAFRQGMVENLVPLVNAHCEEHMPGVEIPERVIFEVTQSVLLPGATGGKSLDEPEYAPKTLDGCRELEALLTDPTSIHGQRIWGLVKTSVLEGVEKDRSRKVKVDG